MRKLLQKQVSDSKKGSVNISDSQNKTTVGLVFVNELYDGWKKGCLIILRNKFGTVTGKFAPDKEILSELQKCAVGQDGNLKQIQKLCMPFLRFKKDEVMTVGIQALNLKLPFGEIEVLETNSDLIRRQLGIERLEILSAEDPNAVQKAGSYASLLRQNPPSPGNPTAIFLNQ